MNIFYIVLIVLVLILIIVCIKAKAVGALFELIGEVLGGIFESFGD